MIKSNPKVGFIFTTKNRVNFTLRSLASIDTETGFDLIWVDGSDTPEGRALPEAIKLRNCRLVEVHYDIKGGPDNAIRFGLRRLLKLGYDYCGLIENDITFSPNPGWFRKLMELFELGEKDGLKVGAATVRTISSRVLVNQPQYVILWLTGAGMILFTREGAQVILATYPPSTDAKSVSKFYTNMLGVDLKDVWELWMGQPNRRLGSDWAFSMQLYKWGLWSLGSIPSMAFNMDFKPEETLHSSWVDERVQVSETDNQRFVRLKMVMSRREKASTVKRCFLLVDSVKSGAWWLQSRNEYLRRILHPVRSAKSVYRRASMRIYRGLAERQFRKIRRGHRDRCWCGGELLPFKWHPSYGVCANCGCYVNRRPPMDLQQLYSSRLYWHIIQKYHGCPPIEQRADLYKRDGRLDYWLQLIQRYGPPQGTVIEAGCAPGILLAELQARGYKCIGVEPDEETANWVRQNMKVEVRVGLFPNVELPNCDLLLAFDVLEHSPSPDRFVREVSRLLNPAGIAIIQTPVERYGYNPPFGEKFESAFKEFEHLFLFTNKSMDMLAERSGLEIVTSDERLWLHHELCMFRKPRS